MDRGFLGLSSFLGLVFSHLRESAVSGLGLPQGKFPQQRLAEEDHGPPQPSCPALPALPSPAREKQSPSTSSSPMIWRIPVEAPAIREISRAVSRERTGTLFRFVHETCSAGESHLGGVVPCEM